MAVLLCMLLLTGAAGDVAKEDVIKLAKAGVGDDVIISHLRAQGATMSLSADDIIALKKEGVSERVLQFLLTPQAGEAKGTAERGKTMLILSNQDESPYSVMVDEGSKKIYFYHGNMRDRIVLGKGESREVALSAGAYDVRWVGEAQSYKVNLSEGATAKLIAGPIRFADYRAVNLSIFEGDREVGGGTLKVFEDRRASVPSAAHSVAHKSTPPTVVYRVVERTPSISYRTDDNVPLIGSNSLFWTGIGAASYRHRRWKGAAIGFTFGHLLDHLGGYRYSNGCR